MDSIVCAFVGEVDKNQDRGDEAKPRARPIKFLKALTIGITEP